MLSYAEFLDTKRHKLGHYGFDPEWLPDGAFDFQKEIITRAIKMGRCGIFVDTGLGKTLIQLAIAKNIVMRTGGRVLILTPLSVAFQFLEEAERIGVEDIEHTKDGKFNKKIVVCNYERLHLLNRDDFVCVMLDESSILKSFSGSTKNALSSFMKKTQYRYLSTATPSPNDFTELGNSAEALGYMGYMDMLTKFFRNTNGSIDSNNRNIGEKFYLKPHAESDFFAWVNQWSIMVKMPSDINYSNDGYTLPELRVRKHIVSNDEFLNSNGQIEMFARPAITMSEVRKEQSATVGKRCDRAVQLAEDKTSVYWCNTNEESLTLKRMDREAIEITGGMSIDKKEEILKSFSSGDIKRLITKAKITGMGLNWQHCNHTVFFPTWSYEQYYQAIRRFWRFGQKREVTCEMVIGEGQGRVLKAIEEKTEKTTVLHSKIVKNTNNNFSNKIKSFDKNTTLPGFLK